MAIASMAPGVVSGPSPRVTRLYARLWQHMRRKRDWWGAGLTVLDDPEVASRPLIVRKARAIEKVLAEMPIHIEDEELVVGSVLMGGALGRLFPDYATEEEKAAAAGRCLSVFSVFGHSVPDYARVLQKGFGGLRQEAQERLAAIAGTDPEAARQRAFLQAATVCCEAMIALGRRYSQLAAEMAARAEEPQRRAELEEIAGICAQVPEKPAQSFREAVQSFWFTFAALNSTLTNAPVGRFDYYVGPYLDHDLAEAKITTDQAQELIDCLWLKFNERVQLREEDKEYHPDPYRGVALGVDPGDPDRFPGPRFPGPMTPDDTAGKGGERDNAMDNHWLQNMILGGMTPDGRDSTNELTYLCLESTGRFELNEPTVSVRLSPDGSERLLRKCCEVIRGGGGMPALFNDRVIAPALHRFGFPSEDANVYSHDGCWETLIPGKTQFYWGSIHGLLCLEYVLHRGVNPLNGRQEGLDTGDPDAFHSFEAFVAALETQIDYQIQAFMASFERVYGSTYDIAPEPLMSTLLEGCLETARDMTEGGARYIFYSPVLSGLPHLVDSLAVIRALVFEKSAFSLLHLRDVLAADYEGQETLRQMLLNRYPKFGNGTKSVDHLAARLAHYFAQQVGRHARDYPRFRFPPGLGAIGWLYMPFGKRVGATPDGRRSREAISAGLTPGAGRDVEGPTAAVKSYTAVNFTELPTGGPLDLGMDANAIRGEAGLQRLMAFVRAFQEMGGSVLTVTVTSVETLLKAQQEPEKYRGLRVRLGGWQAYFVALNREHQDHHITRVRHCLR